MIPIFSNTLGKQELDAIGKVLESRWLGQGEQCKAFEREFAAHLGVDRVLLTNCCTSAIYLALRAVGISPGCAVGISSINFVACANAVEQLGAESVFLDVDDHTLNLKPESIARAKKRGIDALMLLHYGGHPAPMDEIKAALDSPYIPIVEDSACSPASTYHGQACGTLGDAGVWSFDAMKILVMGDGGALWVRDKDAYQRAVSMRYLGYKPKTKSGMDSAKEDNERWWEYELDHASGRFISNDILASVGRIQLSKLSGFIERRAQIWAAYQDAFANIPQLRRPPEPLPGCTSSYYLYWIQCAKRDELARYLYDRGVYTTFRYYPLHLVEHYGAMTRLINAEKAANLTLNLPLHQNLTDEDVAKIITLVTDFFNDRGWRKYYLPQ